MRYRKLLILAVAITCICGSGCSALFESSKPVFDLGASKKSGSLGFIGYMLKTTDASDKWMISGLGLIAGGAIGNLIDRIHIGAVVDFLDFYVGDYHWPAFNVADCALTIGAVCIILSMFFNRNQSTEA